MSAFALRLIACITMLIDHIGFVYHITAFRIIGRLAFPIFLFLTYNGYSHTANKWRYGLRLLVFAVISQVPFSLFVNNGISFVNGNVLFTLLICLICFWTSDAMKGNRILKWGCLLPWILAFGLYQFGVIRSDYGARAVLMAVALYLFYGQRWWQRGLLVLATAGTLFYRCFLLGAVYLKNLALGISGSLSLPTQWEILQIYCLLAFVLIFAYNGEKGGPSWTGRGAKLLQYGFYLFYPVHMLILWYIGIL